jgi:RNA polymerase sigma factor (sigma-70 family)
MSSAEADSELIIRSRADPMVFAEIFDRHHDGLYRYLRRRLGPAAAADVAAEVFLTAFARRGAYRPAGDSARPWLFGIAHNLLRNQSRRERQQWLAYARHGVMPDADPAADDAFARVEERADRSAAGLALALARLRAGDRDVLLMFAWADMSYADISSALRIPVGTVRSRLNRARRQLRGETPPEVPSFVKGEVHG